MKTKKKAFIANASPWRRSCCFLFGHDFRFGGTKTSFDADFALTFGEKTKKKRTESSLKMHPIKWHRSCCFLLGHDFCLGTHSHLGAQKPPPIRILPSHLGVKKTKQKGLDHNCTPMVLVLLLSFGAQFSLAWGGHSSHFGVTAQK